MFLEFVLTFFARLGILDFPNRTGVTVALTILNMVGSAVFFVSALLIAIYGCFVFAGRRPVSVRTGGCTSRGASPCFFVLKSLNRMRFSMICSVNKNPDIRGINSRQATVIFEKLNMACDNLELIHDYFEKCDQCGDIDITSAPGLMRLVYEIISAIQQSKIMLCPKLDKDYAAEADKFAKLGINYIV